MHFEIQRFEQWAQTQGFFRDLGIMYKLKLRWSFWLVIKTVFDSKLNAEKLKMKEKENYYNIYTVLQLTNTLIKLTT